MKDDTDPKKITRAIRDSMDIIERGQERRNRRSKYEDLALCGTCMYLHAETTKYGTRRCWCTELRRKITATDPIIDCTDYGPVGSMSLSLLMSMALPIEVTNKMKQVGFIYDEDEDDYPSRYKTVEL